MTIFAETLAAARQYHQAGNLREAERHYRQALQMSPSQADVWCFLGVACQGQGKLDLAVASFEEALKLKSDHAEVHNNLGVALAALGRLVEAAAHYQDALRLNPSYSQAHNNLGIILAAQGRIDEAIACYRRALALWPDYASAHSNLGVALVAQGQLEAAAACYQRALEIRPDYADAINNLGVTFRMKGELESAVACYRRALEIRPDLVDAHVNLATVLLLLGDFKTGWPEYEWRWWYRQSGPRSFAQPRWQGEPLEGRTILLYAEQGLGDTIQFIRYAHLVKERGGRVLVECQKALAPLLASCTSIDQLVVHGAPLPPFDLQLPLLSLPLVFGTTVATVPGNVPYLMAKGMLAEHWRQELDSVPGFRVGIAWQGNPETANDRCRSVPLVSFAPLAQAHGVRLISLQKGYGSEQVREATTRFPIIDWTSRLDESAGPFMDTAALMTSLDLVVTSDTVIAHLAGALGMPVWVALPFAPDWRWPMGREDSLWYPTMRLFRLRQPGDWGEVFERIAAEVSKLASERPGS
jgi:Flp pilus assembly protein TadD